MTTPAARFLLAYAEAEAHYDWALVNSKKLPAGERSASATLPHQNAGVRCARPEGRFGRPTEDFKRSMLSCARAAAALRRPSEKAALAGTL